MTEIIKIPAREFTILKLFRFVIRLKQLHSDHRKHVHNNCEDNSDIPYRSHTASYRVQQISHCFPRLGELQHSKLRSKIQRTGYLTAFKRKIFPGIRYTWEEKTGNVLEEILKLNIENHDEGSEVSNFPSGYFFGDRLVSPKKGALSTLGLKAKRIWWKKK